MAVKRQRQGYWFLVARQFRRNKLAVLGLCILAFLLFVALAAPFLAEDRPIYMVESGKAYWFPNIIQYKGLVHLEGAFHRWQPEEGAVTIRPLVAYAPERSNPRNRLKPPSSDHLLGTDDRGRDILSRMIWGTRVSMSVGFIAVGIAVIIGVILGALAGYRGGLSDAVVLRVIEVLKCFPFLILILTLISLLPQSIYTIMIVLGLVRWTGTARLVRGEFLKHRESDYATAARATGLSDRRIMFRHLLPNALAPVLVNATFGIAGAILIETALSFLGLGVPPPTASWGEILSQSKRYVDFAWWLVTFPGLAIFITVTAFNLVGEGLRDAMDPRLRQ